ncbi:hypothetical protein MIPYR_40245 [uncultured Microbacterium sp.]|uniref:Uncharacterized protein n=1 Tax=uncultured Microbacterium sp. TaxID=191216 RepID=A0A1Y5P4H9_9MICO|nr:hypothetical protein MIPYR_40245 [uncultured Microbacterium sp.]
MTSRAHGASLSAARVTAPAYGWALRNGGEFPASATRLLLEAAGRGAGVPAPPRASLRVSRC